MLSTGTTSSTNPPTAQVESSRNWGLDTVDQQVTMVHIAWFTFGQGTINRFPNLDGNHISSDEQEKQQDSYAYTGVTHQRPILFQTSASKQQVHFINHKQ